MAVRPTRSSGVVLADPNVRSLKIDVDTNEAVVKLNGNIDTQQHKERAMQVAQSVGGVKQVVDNLRVTG
jgi:hyperosmotically inducible protein